MRRLVRNIRRKSKLLSQYIITGWQAPRYREAFSRVQVFVLFIGYPRSGHSLVGSLLDAHPDAIIAHEANALKAFRYGFRRDRLFLYLLRNSERFTRSGRTSTGYTYLVPGQWQGRFMDLRAIGDKFGDFTAKDLMRYPGLLHRLQAAIKVPVKFIHVIRNPYDNISTIHRRSRRDLRESIDYYFSLVEDVSKIKGRIPPEDLFEIHLEHLIESPVEILDACCRFLGIVPKEDYLHACASLIFKQPKKTREDVDWPRELIEEVKERARAFPFIAEEYASFGVQHGSSFLSLPLH